MATDFGRDTSCTTGLRSGRLVSGVRLVAEAAYRRLTTPRGSLRGGDDEANYGIDLLDLLGGVASKSAAAALGGRIESELRKDERITDVRVEVLLTRDGPASTYAITVEGDTDAGPFALKVAVKDVTIELLGIEAEA